MLRSAFVMLLVSAMSLTAQTTAAPAAQDNAATPTAAAVPAEVAIQVDLAKPLGTYKTIGRWFGYDEIGLHVHAVREATAGRAARYVACAGLHSRAPSVHLRAMESPA